MGSIPREYYAAEQKQKMQFERQTLELSRWLSLGSHAISTTGSLRREMEPYTAAVTAAGEQTSAALFDLDCNDINTVGFLSQTGWLYYRSQHGNELL